MLASALRFTGLIAILVGSLAEAENTTCAGNALDWYSDAVGETPYQVPTFSNTAPGDKCNDQLTVSKTPTGVMSTESTRAMVHTTSILTAAVLAQMNLFLWQYRRQSVMKGSNLTTSSTICFGTPAPVHTQEKLQDRISIIVNFYRIYSNIIVHFVIAYTRSVNNREPRWVFKQRFIHCYEQQSQHINGSRRQRIAALQIAVQGRSSALQTAFVIRYHHATSTIGRAHLDIYAVDEISCYSPTVRETTASDVSQL
ncbi:hypothetical protein POSPLADRAFT_1139264 [Postia placenta MAD-698-R-SB12]|uniref:Uncharacterized protein n=1 Tax=Postia placenta MAD-698-R-SB12 TaxID=670580 RepID=A0A1X6N3X1_9APHY|nr:hypothetical protein POSPLADRAFT_1139264 [Postia placenta MAD-698-R-SB12]OSX63220.1 hypothetical protein POSPLADRAFT_1139264 [Postia placenta MAD-698-R-SB12]